MLNVFLCALYKSSFAFRLRLPFSFHFLLHQAKVAAAAVADAHTAHKLTNFSSQLHCNKFNAKCIMSLDGAQLNYVNAAGTTVAYTAKGRNFNVGSFLGCDLVLPDAERIHCEIQCDAFGRVSTVCAFVCFMCVCGCGCVFVCK